VGGSPENLWSQVFHRLSGGGVGDRKLRDREYSIHSYGVATQKPVEAPEPPPEVGCGGGNGSAKVYDTFRGGLFHGLSTCK